VGCANTWPRVWARMIMAFPCNLIPIIINNLIMHANIDLSSNLQVTWNANMCIQKRYVPSSAAHLWPQRLSIDVRPALIII